MPHQAAGRPLFNFVNGGATATVASQDVGGAVGAVLTASVAFREASGPPVVSGLQYNAVSCTSIANNGGFLRLRTFYLFDPASGSNNFSVAYSGATGTVSAILPWQTLVGMDTGVAPIATSPGTFSGAAGATHSVVATSTTGDEVVFTFLMRDSTGVRSTSSETGFTEREQGGDGNVLSIAIGEGVSAGATHTGSLIWNNDGGDSGLSSAVSYRVASAGTTLSLRGTARAVVRLTGGTLDAALALALGAARAAGRLSGLTLTSSTAMQAGAARGVARLPGAVLPSAVPLRGLARGAGRLAGAELTMLTVLALRGVSRAGARLPGATLATHVALRGRSRATAILSGSTLVSAIALGPGAVRAIARKLGTTISSVVILQPSAVRSVGRLLGLDLIDIANAAAPGPHPLTVSFLDVEKSVELVVVRHGATFTPLTKSAEFTQ